MYALFRSHHPREPFWALWRRGWRGLFEVNSSIVPPLALLYYLGSFIEWMCLDIIEPWSKILAGVILAGTLIAGLLALLFGIPAWVGLFRLDPTSVREDYADAMASHVDAVAEAQGIVWDDVWIGRVDQLMREGHEVEAKRLYHAEAGLKWDAVTEHFREWPAVRLHAKLEWLARRSAERGPTETSRELASSHTP